MTAGFWGERLAGTFIGKGPEVLVELLITHGSLLVVALIQCDSLLEGKQVLSPPGALQGFGNLLLAMLAMGVT